MATGLTYRKYETDAGTVVRIRASTQVAGITGQGTVAGAVDDGNVFAFASNPGSKRKKQLNARGIVLGRTVGTPPNEIVRRTFVPVFTNAALEAYVIDAPVAAYGGFAWKILDKVQEA